MNGYTMFSGENLLQAKAHEWSTRFLLVLTAESCTGNDTVIIVLDKDRLSDAIISLYSMRNHAEVYCTKHYMLCLYQRHSDGKIHKIGYSFR